MLDAGLVPRSTRSATAVVAIAGSIAADARRRLHLRVEIGYGVQPVAASTRDSATSIASGTPGAPIDDVGARLRDAGGVSPTAPRSRSHAARSRIAGLRPIPTSRSASRYATSPATVGEDRRVDLHPRTIPT